MGRTYKHGRLKNYEVIVDNIEDNKVRIFTDSRELYELYKLDVYDKFYFVGYVDIEELDCIWKEGDYEVIEVVKGEIRVEKDSYPPYKLEDNIYHRRYKAKYKGQIYENIQGINNKYRYQLVSYDFQSQDFGFKMISPGIFSRDVKPEAIELEYTEDMWCYYKDLILVPYFSEGEYWWIAPYSRQNYTKEELESKGFTIRKTQLMKYIHKDDIDDIWIVKKGTGGWKDNYFEIKVVKGDVPKKFSNDFI